MLILVQKGAAGIADRREVSHRQFVFSGEVPPKRLKNVLRRLNTPRVWVTSAIQA